jgi:hypothetical protein
MVNNFIFHYERRRRFGIQRSETLQDRSNHIFYVVESFLDPGDRQIRAAQPGATFVSPSRENLTVFVFGAEDCNPRIYQTGMKPSSKYDISESGALEDEATTDRRYCDDGAA